MKSETTDDIAISNFDYPWEDSVIIAFRDIQWQLHIKSNQGGKIPPALLKFDGNAETQAADAVTSHHSRFFLFEFKRSEAAIGSDMDKPMWKLFEVAIEHEKEAKVFRRLANQCHHFAYSEKIETANGGKSISMQLSSTSYYQAVKHKSKKIDANAPSATQSSSIRSMPLLGLMEDPSMGLSFDKMCLYLETLAKIVGDGDDAPIKCVVASSDGFLWPVATLKTFHRLAHLFDEAITNQQREIQVLESDLTQFSTFYKGKQNEELKNKKSSLSKPGVG